MAEVASGYRKLYYPKIRSWINNWRRAAGWKALPLSFILLFFWAAVFAIFYRMLLYFNSTEDIGLLLTVKLVSMTLVSFLLILLFSNLISAFTTFFFSDDLYLLVASPVDLHRIYLSRFAETFIHASWMVFLMSVPIFAALGLMFGVGPLFYFSAVGVMIPLALIPTSVGVILSLVLINIFVARRTREILAFVSVIGLGALVIAFRFLQPEKLIRRHEMESLVSFFSLLRTPDSPLSPHFWATGVLVDMLGINIGQPKATLFFLLLLWIVSAGLFSAGYFSMKALYRRGFSRAQESDTLRQNKRYSGEGILTLYSRLFPGRVTRELIVKDLRTLVRDRSQWSQMLLLAGLVVVYLYNFSVMPIDRTPIPRYILDFMMTYLNLGLAGFVLASICSRFVFPGVSLEGKSFWLLRTAPVSLRRFLWAKMLALSLPLMVLGQFLVYMSSYILKSDPLATLLGCCVVFTLTLAITGLGTGLGAIFPRFEVENPAQIPTGFGGMIYMVSSLALIGITLALLARPIHFLLSARLDKSVPDQSQIVEILGFTALIAVFHLAVMRISMNRGCKNLETLEF